jgi:hypothetical protein
MRLLIKSLKGSFREWLIAAVLVLAGVALLHSRWASPSWANEAGADAYTGDDECQ